MAAALTRKGVIGVEEIDLLSAISVNVTGGHTDSVALPISESIVRGAPVIDCNIDQSLLVSVVFQHQVRSVVP